MGTLCDYSGPYTPRYVDAARRALDIADCVVFVGPRASACLRAKRSADDRLFAFPSLKTASTFLSGFLEPGDLVLLKGSIRTDHLERLILARTANVKCWRSTCGRAYFCDACSLVDRAPDSGKAQAIATPMNAIAEDAGAGVDNAMPPRASAAVVVGLGNPGESYAGTRHNVGQSALDVLASRLSGTWASDIEGAIVMRTRWKDETIWLMKLTSAMNDAGPTLLSLTRELGFTLAECILLHDDLDLPVGAVRARYRGGDGGQRGVQSIIQAFQDDKVRRVKIGIGKPEANEPVIEYVLAPFLRASCGGRRCQRGGSRPRAGSSA
jgi:aminoacyl-tRNA hydrolase